MTSRLCSVIKNPWFPVKLALILAGFCGFLGCAWAESAPAVEFSPPVWKYGMIEQGDIARTRVEARNRTDGRLRVSVVSTCDCLRVSPSFRLLAPGEAGSFDLAFDSSDYSGITTRGYIVNTDISGAKPLYYLLRGVVRVERKPVVPSASEAAAPAGAGLLTPNPGALLITYYYTQGCRRCEEFLSEEIPRLESRMGVSVQVAKKDLLDPKNFEELSGLAFATGRQVEAMPVLAIGDRLIMGDAKIREELPGLLFVAKGSAGAANTGDKGGGAPGSAPAMDSGGFVDRLAVLPVMAAGLVDGINPCAFTTLIFLLASLALAGKGKREVLVIGALFSLSVFLTYLGVGLGLFAALRAASAVALVSVLLRWMIFAALVVFALLSLFDYTRIRAGAPSEMILQLPSSLKLRIHTSIRARAKTVALVGSSLAMGFLVSIFEFACTGQVYLPTLAYLARVGKRADALGLLILYNLSFIAPLLVVFAASYLGVGSKRITVLFQRHMGKVKLALALAFLVLAAMTALV